MIEFDEEKKRIKEICELYTRINDICPVNDIYTEEKDPEFKRLLQLHDELRNAFYHMARIFAVKTDMTKEDVDKEKMKDIENQYKSVEEGIIRYSLDVMDRTSITLRKKISDEVKPFSLDTLSKVMQEYYPTIKPDVEKTNQKIDKLQENKDIGSAYDEGIEKIKEHINRIEKLKGYYKQILEKKQALIDYEEQRRKENIKQILIIILTGVIVAIINGVIGFLIGKFL